MRIYVSGEDGIVLMRLYTIGDLHLNFGSELKAKNQIEGKVGLATPRGDIPQKL